MLRGTWFFKCLLCILCSHLSHFLHPSLPARSQIIIEAFPHSFRFVWFHAPAPTSKAWGGIGEVEARFTAVHVNTINPTNFVEFRFTVRRRISSSAFWLSFEWYSERVSVNCSSSESEMILNLRNPKSSRISNDVTDLKKNITLSTSDVRKVLEFTGILFRADDGCVGVYEVDPFEARAVTSREWGIEDKRTTGRGRGRRIQCLVVGSGYCSLLWGSVHWIVMVRPLRIRMRGGKKRKVELVGAQARGTTSAASWSWGDPHPFIRGYDTFGPSFGTVVAWFFEENMI